MSTLKTRIRLAVDYAIAQGRIQFERDIPRKAVDLGGKMSKGYMGTLSVRLKKNPNGNQHRDKLILIARVCRLRQEWLLFGEGAMELAPVELATKSAMRRR